MKFYSQFKPEIRIIGLDDMPFEPKSQGKLGVIGVVFRGGYWLETVIRTEITIDGLDATENICSMISKLPNLRQLRLVMLNGIMFGGFNVVNIKQLHIISKLPVLSIIRKKPVFSSIRTGMKKLPSFEDRWDALLAAGKIFETISRDNRSKIFFQKIGISNYDAKKIIRLTSTRSNMPEPVRIAHVIASGVGSI